MLARVVTKQSIEGEGSYAYAYGIYTTTERWRLNVFNSARKLSPKAKLDSLDGDKKGGGDDISFRGNKGVRPIPPLFPALIAPCS